MSKRFVRYLLVVTAVYSVWLLIFHFSAQEMDSGAPKAAATSADQMPYEDLAAAYEQLQQQLQKADSTHLIRRYHGRHALFSAERIFDEKVMAATRGHFQSQLGRDKIYLDLPEFDWQRDDEARPVDVLRLSFRGNGIPDNVEQLAHSGLMEPKLHAFYTALIAQNTVLWTRPDASVEFAAKTAQGGLYLAKSTPFIAIQRLSKDYFAKMQAASLPFLWKAYIDEDRQRASQLALLAEPFGPPDLVGPHLPEGFATLRPLTKASDKGPWMPRTQAEVVASHIQNASPEPHGPFANQAQQNVLNALPEIAETLAEKQRQPAISSFNMDEQKVERLFENSLVDESKSLSETLEWKRAINSKHLKDGPLGSASKHLDRLSRLDPEFMTLFLINNLFEQYNIFSVFEKGVHLTMNALDTRMNVLYVSYNLRFDPIAPEDIEFEDIPAGCGSKPVRISDEFFLVAAQPYSYLIRVYLPSCELEANDLAQVDDFLNELRILH
jgi:hypothetical protein